MDFPCPESSLSKINAVIYVSKSERFTLHLNVVKKDATKTWIISILSSSSGVPSQSHTLLRSCRLLVDE